jgi:hypothetical protein
MRRLTLLLLFVTAASAALLAQAPPGWTYRIDRSTNASDPDARGSIRLMAMGSGFHAITPQAAVFWNPANMATGNYSLKGTFTLLKPSSHTNYYGLVFGGRALEGAAQSYTYFLVAQNGSWILKKRTGENVQDVVARTASAAVKRPDASGRSVNDLEVRVAADKVDYVVNGTVVHSMPKAGLTTDGLYGFRVNHELEVQVDGLTKQ